MSLTYTNFACSSIRIIDVKNDREVLVDQLGAFIPDQNVNILLAEHHYTSEVHKAQAKIIEAIVTQKNLAGNFSVGWEFLHYIDQEKIAKNFQAYRANEITQRRFLLNIMGPANIEENLLYVPIFESLARYEGDLIGLNETRKIKGKILAEGLNSLDPSLVPPDFQMGGNLYFERFKAAAGNHREDEKKSETEDELNLRRYFEAQCFTDSVMAYQFSKLDQQQMRFTIVGHFHTDYNDGLVAQIRRYSRFETVTFRFVLKTEEYQLNHEKYGALADYVVLLD